MNGLGSSGSRGIGIGVGIYRGPWRFVKVPLARGLGLE